MKILIACEFSGVVRDAFARAGHDAWSCDLVESQTCGNHIVGDVVGILNDGWDMVVAHPPCDRLCVSGARWKYEKPGWADEQDAAIEFVRRLMDAPIDKIAIENPIGIISTRIRKPDQIIHPWWFGHNETKATCLWLKNLPPLVATHKRPDSVLARIHHIPPSPDRKRLRTSWEFYPRIAAAMADHWG